MSSQIPQRSLGSSGFQVGAIGYGAMMMTWCDPEKVLPDEEAFSAIKSAVDGGANFINSGAFYGNPPDQTANLELLNRFFEKYPEYVDKVVLSVKGGAKGGNIFHGIDSSMDNLREDMDRIHKALGSRKKLDIYECARVDPQMTIEEIMNNLVTLKNEGHFSQIGVSEIHPDALRRAYAVHPIAAVEIELSVFALEKEAVGVVKVAEELDIAVIAYSPLGRGMLTGRYKSIEDFPEKDMRRGMPRYQGDNFKINLEIVDKLNDIAQAKGISSGQLALAYLLQYSDKIIPIPGSGSVTRTLENIKSVNIKLSEQEIKAIDSIQAQFPIQGDRYANNGHGLLWGKGRE